MKTHTRVAISSVNSLILILSGYLVWDQIQIKKNFSAEIAATPAQALSVPAANPAQAKPDALPQQEALPQPLVSGKKISFNYNDSVPKKVAIMGDFNNWKAQPMKKSHPGTWSFTKEILPGQYAYNLIVDGTLIRDPSNSNTIKAGQKIASSLLTVSAAQ